KLSKNLGRRMARIEFAAKVLCNTSIIKVCDAYTWWFAQRKYRRFRRQIQRINELLFWRA
ncbi:PIPO, partial [Japanese yam mosaic virus]|uniref:PIPO n=1 Tax=Japanese yam mosaic virus TaxID=79917 RepID=UPI000264F5C9